MLVVSEVDKGACFVLVLFVLKKNVSRGSVWVVQRLLLTMAGTVVSLLTKPGIVVSLDFGVVEV